MKGLFVFLTLLSLAFGISANACANQSIPQSDDFESYPIGTIFTTVASPPPLASDVWGDSATYTAGLRYNIVETAELDGNPANQVVHIVDVPDATTKNVHLRADFYDHVGQTYGVYEVTMDIKPLQTNGPFKVTMTLGNGNWTSGGNWVAALAFGSTAGNTFFPGMTPGNHLGLQTTTTAWVDTAIAYSANTWYTVKFVIDVYPRLYRVYFGPHAGMLAEVTSGWTPWIAGAASPPTTFGGLYFATSNKVNEGAELLVDNVSCFRVPSSEFVWDTFTRADNWQPGATEDPNHFIWENGYNALGSVTNKELVLGSVASSSDGTFLNNYVPASIDVSAKVRSIGGNGAGIAYRKDPTKEAGNPGFGYKLNWSQDGTSVTLGYYWYGVPQGTVHVYTPPLPIDWTVPHIIRVRAMGTSHKVWLDGELILDVIDAQSTAPGHVVLYRDLSEFHVDDFVMRAEEINTASAALSVPEGTTVFLSGSDIAVSGAFNGFFYVEDINRVAGIKVVSSAPVEVGNHVTVQGTVRFSDGERYIEATSVTHDSAAVLIQPFGMSNRAHGSAFGLSNIGLLTRIWGSVTSEPELTHFYVDDGSGVSYEPGKTGIKVYIGGSELPARGDFVACTGVASTDPGGIPVIRMRTDDDLDTLN